MSPEEISPTSIVGIKRLARTLGARQDIPHLQALDQAAKLGGFENFRHARNQLERKPAQAAQPLSAFTISWEQYPRGMEGVFNVRMEIRDEVVLERLASETLRFDLPEKSGWHFRPAMDPQNRFAPYLDGRTRMLQGRLVSGKWMAILSRNGVQDHEHEQHVRTLPWMLQALEVLATEALDIFLGDLRGDVRVFFTTSGASVAQLHSLRFKNLASALQTRLPAGMTPFAIWSDGSWLTYDNGRLTEPGPTIRHPSRY